MDKGRQRHRWSIAFLVASLALLFAPGFGAVRWAGLVAFIYIGLPWYILSLKDVVARQAAEEPAKGGRFQLRSLTLLVVGILSMVMGVVIDLLLIRAAFTDPEPTSLMLGVIRLLFGMPFFGFGAYLLFLALGRTGRRA